MNNTQERISLARCDLCKSGESDFVTIEFFESLRLFCCIICSDSSCGPSIPNNYERTFELNCIIYGRKPPLINAHGLYALPSPTRLSEDGVDRRFVERKRLQ